jgi:2-C-methyl-D-erythritol 2,4-cyclodiphosphate synthase
VVDTVKRCIDGEACGTIPRNGLWLAQTPQMFRYQLLRAALTAATDPNTITDDASAVEALGLTPKLVEGHPRNLKVTLPDDIRIAETVPGIVPTRTRVNTMALASYNPTPPFRIGTGYDCHALVEGRKLIVGGVTIPHRLGLLGHSDADVLLHAIIDSLLGAAGLGDIGKHFPDTDPMFAGADSRTLLREVASRVIATGYTIGNIDATIIAQQPKMAPHIPQMVSRIAEDIGVSPQQVNIKAKTNEKLGFLGREEGMAAQATALLVKAVRTRAGVVSGRIPAAPDLKRRRLFGQGRHVLLPGVGGGAAWTASDHETVYIRVSPAWTPIFHRRVLVYQARQQRILDRQHQTRLADWRRALVNALAIDGESGACWSGNRRAAAMSEIDLALGVTLHAERHTITMAAGDKTVRS